MNKILKLHEFSSFCFPKSSITVILIKFMQLSLSQRQIVSNMTLKCKNEMHFANDFCYLTYCTGIRKLGRLSLKVNAFTYKNKESR